MASLGTTFAVFTARGVSLQTLACRIIATVGVVTIRIPVAVIIHFIGAEAGFASRMRTAVIRTTAHILTLVA
jgi:hypothetical protein